MSPLIQIIGRDTMSYCKTCHINYNTPLTHCLFCNNELNITDDISQLRYNYPEMKKRKQAKKFLLRLFTFLSLLSIVICFYLDFLSGIKSKEHWSLYVITSVLFVDAIMYLFTGSKRMLRKLTTLSYLTIVYLLFIAILSGYPFWAIDFIYPLGLIALNVSVTCYYLFGHRKELHNLAIYMLIPSLLSIVCVFHLCSLGIVYRWPSIACIGYSLVTIIGLFFFSTKKTKDELKRRFHL